MSADPKYVPSRKHQKALKTVQIMLEKYARRCAWFREWDFCVSAEATSEDGESIAMAVDILNFLMKATFIVYEAALELDETDFEMTVLHELGHVLLSDLTAACVHSMPEPTEGNVPMLSGEWYVATERFCWRFAKSMQAQASS
jgi:hypothetical protein